MKEDKVTTNLDEMVVAITDFGDAEDFEKTKKVSEFIDWLTAHSNLSREQVRRIPFKEMSALQNKVKTAIDEVTIIPKASNGG